MKCIDDGGRRRIKQFNNYDYMQRSMGLILDRNSEIVAHEWLIYNLICDYGRSKQMPYSDQITDFTLHVRPYFWATI